jgi:catechol 2,3-dioxygenase-like lactoylglutathione lyase family enzyme
VQHIASKPGNSADTIEGRRMNEKANQTWYARPVFFVRDCDAASAFYTRLGFRENWRSSYEGEVVALQVSRADVEIILSLDPERAGGGGALPGPKVSFRQASRAKLS